MRQNLVLNTLTNNLAPSETRKGKRIKHFKEGAALSSLVALAQTNSGLAKYESPLRFVQFLEGDELPDGRIAEHATNRLQYGSKKTGPNGELFYEWKYVPVVSCKSIK